MLTWSRQVREGKRKERERRVITSINSLRIVDEKDKTPIDDILVSKKQHKGVVVVCPDCEILHPKDCIGMYYGVIHGKHYIAHGAVRGYINKVCRFETLQVKHKLKTTTLITKEIDNPVDIRGKFKTVTSKARMFQGQFRKKLLRMYNSKCCICGLNMPNFLNGAHIAGVSKNEHVSNDYHDGLILCLTHHKAFDLGLIYIDDNYRVRVNIDVDVDVDVLHSTIKSEIVDRDYQLINLPKNNLPSKEYLSIHRRQFNID